MKHFYQTIQGSGLSGLSAMQSPNQNTQMFKIIPTLLEIKKRDLTKISKKYFGEYIKDPSNRNTKYLKSQKLKAKETIDE